MEILWDERAGVSLPDGWEVALSNVIETGLKSCGAPPNCEVSISFVTADEMSELNDTYRRREGATDVLSFPFCDDLLKKGSHRDVPVGGGPSPGDSAREDFAPCGPFPGDSPSDDSSHGDLLGAASSEIPVMLGDIVICSEIALRQASAYGHGYMRELAFLTAHGLLHLLGFDHESPEDEEIMTKTQKKILIDSGIGKRLADEK